MTGSKTMSDCRFFDGIGRNDVRDVASAPLRPPLHQRDISRSRITEFQVIRHASGIAELPMLDELAIEPQVAGEALVAANFGVSAR